MRYYVESGRPPQPPSGILPDGPLAGCAFDDEDYYKMSCSNTSRESRLSCSHGAAYDFGYESLRHLNRPIHLGNYEIFRTLKLPVNLFAPGYYVALYRRNATVETPNSKQQ